MPAKRAVPRTKEELRALDRERGRRYRARHPERAKEQARRWRETHPGATTARTRAWRERHPGRQRTLSKDWAEKNQARVGQMRKEWYEANKETVKARSRQWYRDHPEDAQEQRRAYRARVLQDPAHVEAERVRNRASQKRRYEADPERARHKAKVRRALRLGAQGSHTFEQWMERVAFYGWRCRYCQKSLMHTSLTMDHAIPLSRGGSEWAANLVPACMSCNCRKRNRTLREFLEV